MKTEDRAWVPAPMVVVDIERGGKWRPAVIIRLREDGIAEVLYCTSSPRDYQPQRRVDAERKEGKSLRLITTSYFYVSGFAEAHVSALRFRAPRCPQDLYLDLVEIAHLGRQKVEAGR